MSIIFFIPTYHHHLPTIIIIYLPSSSLGATTFTKSDIFVKPSAGTATFFSYKGSDGRMDDGYTEHSGCPVLDGEKVGGW